MNTTGPMNIFKNPMAKILAVLFLLVGGQISQAQKIGARPLTHQEIKDFALPAGTMPSGGLMTVGIGEAVYLEVLVAKGEVISDVTWSVASRPVSAPPSVADFQDTPIVPEMEVYSPGDREVYDAVGRTMFIPDVVGVYTVQAVVGTTAGPVVVDAQITGALYVGVGIMGNEPLEGGPDYPQCALCHDERAVDYMGTGHASFFTEAIDGLKSSHYGENCIDCHTLGNSPTADNGSFLSLAEGIWTFPEVLEPGNWDAMPTELQAKANIQCEHCHGAGSEHHGIAENISVSLSSGDCGQCHDDEPYHTKNKEWNLSNHAVATRYPTGKESRQRCVRCHSGIGFIQDMDGVVDNDKSFEYEAIVCASCHDPHSAENEHQVRSIADITLTTGHTVTEGGLGKLCVNCHQSRASGYDAIGTEPSTISTRFGPHYGAQGDIFHGTNLIDYGKVVATPSPHAYALDDSCASCHMQHLPSSDPASGKAGGHTFKIVWDNDTPEDATDDVDLVGACVSCHGPMDSFDDMKKVDYNLDGTIDSVQEEIHQLLEALAMKLPPVGEPTVSIDGSAVYTMQQKKGFWNYKTVVYDLSMGMHNPRYVAGALRASVEDMGDPFNSLFS